MVVLREPAVARSAASASARIDAARAASVSRILAPSWPATWAMSATSASSLIPVSRARRASAVHGAAPAGRVERGRDPLERPAVADLGGGLERLGGARAGAALQRHQVEVAGEGPLEVGPPLGRVHPGDQVGSEE